MQVGVGLLILDVMPIYMIIPRYSHNYAQFYQLLDSNLFTHRNTYAILREATSETYGPRVYSYHIIVRSINIKNTKIPCRDLFTFILFCTFTYLLYLFYFAFLTFSLYHKNTKDIILSSLSDLTFASGREGIDNPFIALVARFLFVCVGARDLCVASYWIDTLVLKN